MSAEPIEDNKDVEEGKSSKKKLIIIVVLVLLLGAGGFIGWTKFSKKEADAGAKKHEVVEPVIKDMEPFLVNLSDPGGKRYLKITIKAKLNGRDAEKEFTARAFEMRDLILMILSSKEFEEIAMPEDKATLKQEIIARLNKAMHNGQVEDLYFTDFLVQ